MPNLRVTYNSFTQEIDKLNDLQSNIISLLPGHQKLISEIVILRMFDLLQSLFKVCCQKLLCGAVYLDNSNPLTLVAARSMENALYLFKNHGRTHPVSILHWSTISEINNNLKYTFHQNNHFWIELNNHSLLIDELRKIRNRIAHNNPKSRQKYQIIVRRYYGAKLNHITPGILLMSLKNHPILIIDYLLKTKVLVKNLLKA